MAEKIIASVTDNQTASLSASALAMVSLIRKRAKLYEQDKSASIFAWPRDYVKTHNCDLYTVRKQADLTVNGSGVIQIDKETDETFAGFNNDNYQFAVVKQSTNSSRTLTNGMLLLPTDNSHSDIWRF